ncbi:MAG TPA: helicase-related protein [Solirubrobacteraceae bacterium]|nr:helicase-related protein [Solirubrobacteraceae bacterium]
MLAPCVSLDMIRLAAALGGTIGRDLKSVTVPLRSAPELLARINTNVLHAGDVAMLEQSAKIAEALEVVFGQRVAVCLSADKRDRWGRLRANRWSGGADAAGAVQLQVMTTTVKGFAVNRVGNARPQHRDSPDSTSVAMELGEAVNCAIERGLPLLLSSEAAGLLDGTIRVGRMKGRPGMITITSSDGLQATTQAVSVEQAVGRLRTLRDGDGRHAVILDAGAKQVLRMFLAKPLTDDPVLLGRQREVGAMMAVGSGVNAAQTGSGKTVMTCRGAIYQRAATVPGCRVLLIAEGRLLGQWLDAMRHGAPGRGMAALVPNVRVLRVDERTSIAGQIRAFHRQCGRRPGVVLVANSILDRFPGDLKVIDWHLLVADEADRYVNTLTAAHQALRTVRMQAVADCWLLTATPRGKSSEHLDVLVGLAVGDEGMIGERLNTREGGDLMSEVNAHRVRLNYGPHLVRVTRADMRDWMPDVRPAQPIVVEADGALRELLDAIRDGGQDAYRQLLRVLAQLKTLDKGSELHRQALAEVSRCQAQVLGNVGVFVDASVDPASLLHSKAALAQALVRQGLVGAAARGGGDGQPTLRGVVAQAIAAIAGDEQLLVFADRVRCLHQLAETLNDRHHVETHVADGSLKPDEFEALKRRFVAGAFAVLCLSKVGQQGHDLQNAGSLVQLDLPWTPTGLEQRVGRAARPGNARGYVQTFIPYIKGGGVEHIVKILAGRGGEHHLLLDSYEGLSARESTIATQLGAITTQVADSKQDAGYAGTAARLRVAAAVFGAH